MTDISSAMGKGVNVNGYLKYIKKKWGLMGKEEALHHACLGCEPKDAEWIPMEQILKVIEWIVEKHGEDAAINAGKEALADMGMFRYMFSSVVDEKDMLNRSLDYYHVLFNFGDAEVEYGEDGSAIFVFHDFRMNEMSRIMMEGMILGMTDIAKKRVNLKEEGSDETMECRIRISWKDK